VLQVVTRVGGLVAGAFAADGELVGFVFGLAGLIGGELAHWSHVLGVRESARDAGVGRSLKEYQRAELARRGISHMYWTFDPLQAKNAHLNLNLLGARVVEYVRDMYGTTASPLHHGLATDRIVVACATSPDRSLPAHEAARPSGRCPVLTPEPQDGDIAFDAADPARPPALWLEIPADIQLVIASVPGVAAAWHAATRRHFEWALQNAYSVIGLHRDPVTSRAYYVLELTPQARTA
jgi:predicted GNAT superfamily acetyltransferase